MTFYSCRWERMAGSLIKSLLSQGGCKSINKKTQWHLGAREHNDELLSGINASINLLKQLSKGYLFELMSFSSEPKAAFMECLCSPNHSIKVLNCNVIRSSILSQSCSTIWIFLKWCYICRSFGCLCWRRNDYIHLFSLTLSAAERFWLSLLAAVWSFGLEIPLSTEVLTVHNADGDVANFSCFILY